MNFSQHLASHNVTSLFYLTSVDNLEPILKRGILCRELAQEHEYADISCNSVQRRRIGYHSHVPLFFTDNTPMLYVCVKTSADVILLEIASEVTNRDGVMFFDGNAAAGQTLQYNDPTDLNLLDWKVIHSRRGAYGSSWKRIRSAEVHIPQVCPASYITGVYFQLNLDGGYSKLQKIINDSPQSHDIFIDDSLTRTGANTNVKN